MYRMHSLAFCLLLTCLSCSFTFAPTPLYAKTKKPRGGGVDLESVLSPFILETKKLSLPDYPQAFNPALVRWKDGWLLGCRVIKNKTQKGWQSYVALVALDKNFKPKGSVQLLNTRSMAPTQPFNSADPRLLWVGDRLYVVYSDTLDTEGRAPFIVRMWVGLVEEHRGTLTLVAPERLSSCTNETLHIIEKNWIPFSYEDQLLFAYYILPHRILRPFLDGSGRLEKICSTQLAAPSWKWGELRGGTPGVKLQDNNGDYLAFFHSCLPAKSLHSEGKTTLHYFMGAYRFSGEPPFPITHMSPTPIVGKGFYQGKQYDPYWRPVQAIFPSGLVIEGDYAWLAYGRQDHEIWVAKIDIKKLLGSLQPVVSVEN